MLICWIAWNRNDLAPFHFEANIFRYFWQMHFDIWDKYLFAGLRCLYCVRQEWSCTFSFWCKMFGCLFLVQFLFFFWCSRCFDVGQSWILETNVRFSKTRNAAFPSIKRSHNEIFHFEIFHPSKGHIIKFSIMKFSIH